MKKIIILGLVLTFIAPQIVLAAWWNPFTWNIFNRKNQKTLMLENQVKELENGLNNLDKPQQDFSTTTNESSTKTEPSRPPVVTKITNKTPSNQIVNKNTSVVAPVQQSISTDDLFNAINIKINKLFDIRDGVKLLGEMKDINKSDINLVYSKQTEITGTISNGSQDRDNYKKVISQSSQSDHNRNINLLNTLISDLDKKIVQYTSDSANLKTNILRNIEADKISAVSAEIELSKDKLARLKTINLEIANLNAKRVKDIASISGVAGQTESQYNISLNTIERQYTNEYNRLMAEFQQIKYSN